MLQIELPLSVIIDLIAVQFQQAIPEHALLKIGIPGGAISTSQDKTLTIVWEDTHVGAA